MATFQDILLNSSRKPTGLTHTPKSLGTMFGNYGKELEEMYSNLTKEQQYKIMEGLEKENPMYLYDYETQIAKLMQTKLMNKYIKQEKISNLENQMKNHMEKLKRELKEAEENELAIERGKQISKTLFD